MAHKLGAAFNLPHGIANALLLNQVIKFNATDCPEKQAAFPQYRYPNAKERYGQIANELRLGGTTDDERVARLLEAITQLKKEVNIPLSIKDAGVAEEEFNAKLDTLVEQAFDDQCTGANPVYPLMKEIRQIYIDAYHGVV